MDGEVLNMKIPLINNEINLNETAFSMMKDNHAKEEVISIINDAIESCNIPFPIKNTNLEEATKDFAVLQSEDSLKHIKRGEFFHRYDYDTPFSDIYIASSLAGLKSSNYFNFDARMLCDSINSPSPMRTWNSYKFRKSMLGALFSLKLKEVNSKSFSTCISMRKYVAAQFKPSCAKCIYQLFDSKNILDISSGWGDRLTAFMATEGAESYVGIDPNKALVNGYRGQIDAFNGDKNITMHCDTAEDAVVEGKFDTIFTSPPYFNIERYSKDDNQSYKRYRKLDIWLNDFLYFSLSKYWDKLEDGGIMAINIGDVYSNHTINKICDPMNKFIGTLSGANYMGCIGYRMQKRLRSKSDKKGIFAEPIWIWGKNINKSLNEIVEAKLGGFEQKMGKFLI
jgi:hypothetical protein